MFAARVRRSVELSEKTVPRQPIEGEPPAGKSVSEARMRNLTQNADSRIVDEDIEKRDHTSMPVLFRSQSASAVFDAPALPNTTPDPAIAPEPSPVAAPASGRNPTGVRIYLFALLIFVLLLLPSVRTVKIVGKSMEPTFQSGQVVVALRVYRLVSPLRVGDIVIARPTMGEVGGDEVIKRVFFIQNAEGNAPFPRFATVEGRKIGTLALFPDEFLGRKTARPGDVYLLGDNWQNSIDSRDYGPVSETEILGKVIFQRAANDAAWTTNETAQATTRTATQ